LAKVKLREGAARGWGGRSMREESVTGAILDFQQNGGTSGDRLPA
jgi:hypothetical protein